MRFGNETSKLREAIRKGVLMQDIMQYLLTKLNTMGL